MYTETKESPTGGTVVTLALSAEECRRFQRIIGHAMLGQAYDGEQTRAVAKNIDTVINPAGVVPAPEETDAPSAPIWGDVAYTTLLDPLKTYYCEGPLCKGAQPIWTNTEYVAVCPDKANHHKYTSTCSGKHYCPTCQAYSK